MAKAKGAKPLETPAIPADVMAAMAELGADASFIMLWRIEDGVPAYLGRQSAEAFSLEWVLATFGGGKFQARAVNAANQFKKTFTFTIAGPKRTPPAPENGNGSNGAAHTNGNGHSSSGLPKWVESILVASIPVVAGAIAKRMLEPKTVDPVLLALLNKASKSEGLTPGELVTLLDNARREAKDDARELADMLAARGGKESPSSWADVVRDTVPEILETIRAEQRAGDRPPRTTTRVIPPGQPVALSSSDTAPRWMQRVRPYLGHLLRWADSNKTPEVKAEGVVDDLSEADAADLAEHTTKPTFIADVFAYFPELESTPARKEWFIRFLQRLLDCFEAVETDGAGGASSEHQVEGMPASTSASTPATDGAQ